MPLPLSRDYDAIDSGPLPHTTVNNVQDAIVALSADKVHHCLAADRLVVDNGSAAQPQISGGNVVINSVTMTSFGLLRLDLKKGERLKSWRMNIFVDTASTHVMRVRLVRSAGIQFPTTLAIAAGTETVPGQVDVLSVGGSVGEQQLVSSSLGALPVTANDEYVYHLFINSDVLGGSSGIFIGALEYTTDNP